MISPVSFAGTAQSKTFKDIISQPQAHIAAQPAAASTIKGSNKKSSIGKKILTAVGVAAAIAAALAAGYKTGILDKMLNATEKIKNGTLKSVLGFVSKWTKIAGEKIYETGSNLINMISNKVPEPEVIDDATETLNEQVPKAAEVMQEVAEKIAETTSKA